MIESYSCQLSADAEKEYMDSFVWYEEQQPTLGERFAASVRKRLHTISINTYSYSKKKGQYHEAYLGKPFPFVVIYLIDEKKKLVVVTSIFHHSRHPKMKYRK